MRWKPLDAVAIVTGASSGIGRCLTGLLLQQGAIVVAVARRKDRIADLASSDGKLIPLVGDVTSAADRHAIIDAASQVRNGQIDLLVNNAGIGAIGPFVEASPERLRQIMEVNFFAPVELTRLALSGLRKGPNSVICNVGSVLGHRAVPNKSEYCASKFALHGFSNSLRAELANSGIQVTLVSPSTTRSEFFDALIETKSNTVSKSFGSWSPEQVASATLTAIEKRRSEVILSAGGKTLAYADRLAPRVVDWILARAQK